MKRPSAPSALSSWLMSDDLRRLLVFVALCAGCALLVVDLARPPDAELRVGDVAERTVKSPLTFSFPDHAGYERAREAAREAAPRVAAVPASASASAG